MLNWPVSFVTYKSLNLDVDVTFYVSQHYYFVLHFNILLEGIAKISNFKIENVNLQYSTFWTDSGN